MSIIINPRGTAGSGKTEFARRILADYGGVSGSGSESLHKNGRERPIGYRLQHPSGGPPLIVIGHYERASGGCDTIRAADGGLEAVFRMADGWAAAGHDVLFEGLTWSAEQIRSKELARRHRLHVLLLSTPVDRSARNLVARQRVRNSISSTVTTTLLAQQKSIEAVCADLEPLATVEKREFDGALRRARELLGVEQNSTPCGSASRAASGAELRTRGPKDGSTQIT